MFRVASFDIGHRSLAVCVVDRRLDILCTINWWVMKNSRIIRGLNQLDELKTSDQKIIIQAFIVECTKLINWFIDVFVIKYMSRIDMFPDGLKNTTSIERAKATKSTLSQIDCDLPGFDIVLIEDQTINKLSSEVMHQAAYHYACGSDIVNSTLLVGSDRDFSNVKQGPEVLLRNPRAKNKISLDGGLDIGKFQSENVDLYEANKKHAQANFEKYIELFGSEQLRCKYARLIKHSRRKGRDVADSFMQMWAF